jgi:hypothetical protein
LARRNCASSIPPSIRRSNSAKPAGTAEPAVVPPHGVIQEAIVGLTTLAAWRYVSSGEDAAHVHDPGQDGLPVEDIPDGPDAALTEDEFEPVRHADGLDQSLLANALG